MNKLNQSSRILIFIDWFYPSYKAGGPIKSVYNLVLNLHSCFRFLIVTSNKDIDGTPVDLEHDVIHHREQYQIIYLSKQNQTLKKYTQLLVEYKADIIYYNSVFSFNFTLKPIWYLRTSNVYQIVAPRGMLGAGALNIKKTKKSVFLFLATKFGFFSNVKWHASTKTEKEEILKTFTKADATIAQNLSTPPIHRKISKDFKTQGKLKLIYLSRILPIKNLNFLLSNQFFETSNRDFILDIYGSIEDKTYWESCNNYILHSQQVNYKGIADPQQVSAILKKYHFLILPTLNENYGHVITESILNGLPVIISNNTPWQNLDEENVGRVLPLNDKNEWRNTLQNLLDLKQPQYQEMVENCFHYAKRYIHNGTILKSNIELFSANK